MATVRLSGSDVGSPEEAIVRSLESFKTSNIPSCELHLVSGNDKVRQLVKEFCTKNGCKMTILSDEMTRLTKSTTT